MILLQAYTILLAIALAWLNKIPVLKMINFGASIREEKEFHRANAVVKIFYVFFIVINNGGLLHTITAAILLLLWMWLVFDIALNLFLGHKWYYNGSTAWIDKRLIGLLGKKYAGRLKAYAVGSVILVINFYL